MPKRAPNHIAPDEWPSVWIRKPINIQPIPHSQKPGYCVSVRMGSIGKQTREYFSYGEHSGRTQKEAWMIAKKRIWQIYNQNEYLFKNSYRYLSEDVIEVQLTRGKTMVIDAEDLNHVLEHTWKAEKPYHVWYAINRKKNLRDGGGNVNANNTGTETVELEDVI